MTLHATASSSDYNYLLAIDIVPLKVDWVVIIDDIHQRGLLYLQQADALGVSRTTLNKWRLGSHPGFEYGHAILILHTKVCGTKLTEQRFVEFSQKSYPTP